MLINRGMLEYKYGEEIDYELVLLTSKDKDKLKSFDCGNVKLNHFINEEIVPYDEVINEDGLIYKAEDRETGDIIGIVSLAASGIILSQTNYLKILPAVKIDVFAVDLKYQKMHYNQESEQDADRDNHFYLSDDIMAHVIKRCFEISENYLLVDYILLYADKKAYRFYERNCFLNFENYMEKENNMEINKNIPMYMKL
jgi:hypothetical protein